MGSAEKTNDKGLKKISVLNWIGTLILCAIPGVNILVLLGYAFFSKAQAKRSFAVAMILLIIFTAILICAAFLVFPEQLAQLASQLRGSIPKAAAGNVIVME